VKPLEYLCSLLSNLSKRSSYDRLDNLLATQMNRPFVLKSAARAVTKTCTFHNIVPILDSLHWLKIYERIK